MHEFYPCTRELNNQVREGGATSRRLLRPFRTTQRAADWARAAAMDQMAAQLLQAGVRAGVAESRAAVAEQEVRELRAELVALQEARGRSVVAESRVARAEENNARLQAELEIVVSERLRAVVGAVGRPLT